jgi:peptidoglycan/xylan/chitin deacetylase (PgdA/CDA1 family)
VKACLTFDVDAESPVLAAGRRHAENLGLMSHQAFGPRVGLPRILDLLDDYGIRSTFFVPGLTAERYPGAVEAILARGHEVGHHSYAHHSPIDISEDEERRDFDRALAALDGLGVRPEGFRAPSWEPAWRTPRIVAEHGLVYDSSLFDSDRPYLLDTGAGELVELPVQWALDDWEQYAYAPRPAFHTAIESPAKVLDLWRSELDAAARYDSLFVLTCHPFLSGRAMRVETLRALIEHALARDDVEFAACIDVARGADGLERRMLEPVVADAEIYPGY